MPSTTTCRGRAHFGIGLLIGFAAGSPGNGAAAATVAGAAREGEQWLKSSDHELHPKDRAADIFALTSYSEGMSNAVLEACASGTPVLITDRCNTPEVTEYGAGCVVPPQTGEIAKALRAMLADPQHLTTMGANGPRMVRERFALPAITDRIEAMYQRIAGLSLRRGLRTGELPAAAVSVRKYQRTKFPDFECLLHSRGPIGR